MRGKILFTIISLGATSMAFANGSHFTAPAATISPSVTSETNYFDGLYLGAGLGIQHLTGDIKNYVQDTATLNAPYGNDSLTIVTANANEHDAGNTNPAGEIFAGFGKTFNSQFYTGAELNILYSHASPSSKSKMLNRDLTDANSPIFSVNSSTKINTDFAYGGALKLGYLITPKTMLYVLAGINYAKFNIDSNHSYNMPYDGQNSFSYHYSYGYDEGKWGFAPGIGLETMLTNNLSLKAQYTYADYGSITHNNEYNTSGKIEGFGDIKYLTTSTAADKINLSSNTFTLGLTYHFNGL